MINLMYNGKKLESLTLDDLNYCEENEIIILNNNVIIGEMIIYNNDLRFNLEEFQIKPEFRGNGFGANAMKKLIQIAKSLNVCYIYGESVEDRKNFYKRMGAMYENRDNFNVLADNLTYDGEKLETFYIDL